MQWFDNPVNMYTLLLYRKALYMSEIEKDQSTAEWRALHRSTNLLLSLGMIKKYPPIRKWKQKYIVTKKGAKIARFI